MSHYAASSGNVYSHGQIPYSPTAGLYPTCYPTFLPNQGHGASRMAPDPSQIPLHHQRNSAEYTAIPAEQQFVRDDNYPGGLAYGHESHMIQETETQETFSENEQSEPVVPTLDGYPNVKEFDQLIERYT